jgi:hypothetical protein
MQVTTDTTISGYTLLRFGGRFWLGFDPCQSYANATLCYANQDDSDQDLTNTEATFV